MWLGCIQTLRKAMALTRTAERPRCWLLPHKDRDVVIVASRAWMVAGLAVVAVSGHAQQTANAVTATAYCLRQAIDNNAFLRSCPFQLLVSLRAVKRDFEGPSGAFWNVAGATSRLSMRARCAS